MKVKAYDERLLIPTLWGEEIGVLIEGKNGVSFQYDSAFDSEKYPISPLRLPFDASRVFNYYDSIPFEGLPGIFADSLPDSFGNVALREYFKRKTGRGFIKLSPLEKLAYVGSHGIGAIEYKPAIDEKHETYAIAMELQHYAQETKNLMTGQMEEVLIELIAHPSPGGSRPKAAVQWRESDNSVILTSERVEGYEPWIIKFDETDREETKLEYLYMQIAKKVGIDVPEFKQVYIDNETHFATKRFDRVEEKKLHQATLAGLIHGDFMQQNACSYEEYLRMSEVLTQSPAMTKEAYRRMVFNVVGKNCDDHLKNFSFLMNQDSEWSLSPAYDLLYSFGAVSYGEHKMSINGKNSNITIEDLASCGYSVGLEKHFMKACIEEISDAFSQMKKILHTVGIREGLSTEIVKEITPLSVTMFPNEKAKKKR